MRRRARMTRLRLPPRYDRSYGGLRRRCSPGLALDAVSPMPCDAIKRTYAEVLEKISKPTGAGNRLAAVEPSALSAEEIAYAPVAES